MKKTAIILMFLLVSFSAFAEEPSTNPRYRGWVAFTGGALFGLTASGYGVEVDNTPYYNIGITMGGNFSKYVGIETRPVFVHI